MKWNNLKSYKCPDCGAPLTQRGDMHTCKECTFKIGEEKLKQIISKKPTRYIEPDRSKWEW